MRRLPRRLTIYLRDLRFVAVRLRIRRILFKRFVKYRLSSQTDAGVLVAILRQVEALDALSSKGKVVQLPVSGKKDGHDVSGRTPSSCARSGV